MNWKTVEELNEWCLSYAKNMPIPVCKGEAKKQADINNEVSADQLAYMKATAQGYLNYSNKLMAGGGYSPGVREALVSTAVNQVPQAYSNIAKNLQTAAMARGLSGGGTLPGGGGYLANYGNLLSQEEQTKAGLLNNITAQGQQNIMSAEGGLIPLTSSFGQTGASALGSATSAANQANQSSGLLGTIIGGGLGVLGSYLGKPGCWVAAEIYGWYSPEMLSIRRWIFSTWYMKPFAAFYLKYGKRWAERIRTDSTLRFFTKKLFAWFLKNAR